MYFSTLFLKPTVTIFTALFRAAIQQSGTSMNTIYFREKAKDVAFDMAIALEPLFHSNRSEDVLDALQRATTSDILFAAERVKVCIQTN